MGGPSSSASTWRAITEGTEQPSPPTVVPRLPHHAASCSAALHHCHSASGHKVCAYTTLNTSLDASMTKLLGLTASRAFSSTLWPVSMSCAFVGAGQGR